MPDSDKTPDNRSPLERFEDLAKHAFNMTEEEVEKVKRETEELATDLVKPASRSLGWMSSVAKEPKYSEYLARP